MNSDEIRDGLSVLKLKKGGQKNHDSFTLTLLLKYFVLNIKGKINSYIHVRLFLRF